ncbi:DNA-binding FadR family transcriptional regulator [Mucilaginibacter yixingensis]|uniref:DNA-binding FadR family transcriptional regulator n=1 Tax=Mucilaginibacter yixingensis TaxID=1295612 RepID=A0A2T5J690_9SPHI|nr:GntR family transcriptional regulator [Mucilaginibacter yixingensis]PTQ94009.1 DNA-binding FadR family transcriptional regulator [Mucilaginibacter yixingensis]
MLIQKRSLAEEVAARLQEQISLGHYKVNEKLPIEPELMKAFGVGRSTIREAIKLLANSGLLRVQQGVGTFVERTTSGAEPMDQRLKRAKVTDLDEIRQLLEMKIAEKAAANRTDRNIEEISMHLTERKIAADANMVEAAVEADIQFHIAIAEASGNQILADLYKSAAIHLKQWFLQIHNNTHPYTETHHLHEQLLNCIVERDTANAWRTAEKIINYR